MEAVDLALRLIAAAVIGGLIGLNRDLHHKPTGLRTLSLVSLGAALATLVASGGTTDPSGGSRALQGVITGIGFLGAGVIIREPMASKVHGLTTAAATWVTACLGCACGLGAWLAVCVATLMIAIILLAGGAIEKSVHRRLERARGDGDEPAAESRHSG